MNPVCEALKDINIEGNIVPHAWLENLRTEKGRPDPIAVLILADIFYWYRPALIKNETTGRIIGYKEKFYADKLQRSYRLYAELFGIGKTTAKRAIDNLVRLKLITKELRNVKIKMGTLSNVMYLEPILENVFLLTRSGLNEEDNSEHALPVSDPPLSESNTPPIAKRQTYTEITTENSPKNTLERAPSPKSKTFFSTNQEKSPSPPLRGTPPPQISGSEEQASNIPSNNKISETNPNIPDQSQTSGKPEITLCSEDDSNISQTTISNPTNNNIEIELVELLYRERTEKFPDIPFSDGEKQRWVAVMNDTLKKRYKPDVLSDAIKFIFNWGDSYWRKRIMKPRNFRENILSVVTQMIEDEQQKKKDEEKEKFFID